MDRCGIKSLNVSTQCKLLSVHSAVTVSTQCSYCQYTVQLLSVHIAVTVMLPCIVIPFILNNQPDALIILIYSVIKLHVSGIFSVHHQEFSTVHSALVSFMQFFLWPLPSRVRMLNASWLCLVAVAACIMWTGGELDSWTVGQSCVGVSGMWAVASTKFRLPLDGAEALKHVTVLIKYCNI